MTRRAQRVTFVAVAVAVAVPVAVVGVGVLAHQQVSRPSRRARVGPRVHRAVSRLPTPIPSLDRRDALLVARRFAAGYAAWDVGRRDELTSRRLARTTTPALFAALGDHVPRRVATPPRPLALRPAGVYRGAGAVFLVPLIAGGGIDVMTLTVVPTPTGARVAQLER
jgi:hypothetical protein